MIIVAKWVLVEGHSVEELGLIPGFLNPDDPRSAREQLDAGYQHGGGWRPMEGFELIGPPDPFCLKYPGDPMIEPFAMTRVHDEFVLVYPHDIVAIVRSPTDFEVARMN